MGYFEAIADSYFKKTTSGQNVFYPWGVLGSGYIIPTEERTSELRRSFKRAGIFSLLYVYLVLFMGKAFGFPVGAGFFLLYTFVYYIVIQTITRNLVKANEKLTTVEFYSNQAKGLSYVNIVLLGLCCLGFVLAGIWVIVQGKGFWVGLSSILFFGFGFLVFLFQLRKKIKDK